MKYYFNINQTDQDSSYDDFLVIECEDPEAFKEEYNRKLQESYVHNKEKFWDILNSEFPQSYPNRSNDIKGRMARYTELLPNLIKFICIGEYNFYAAYMDGYKPDFIESYESLDSWGEKISNFHKKKLN